MTTMTSFDVQINNQQGQDDGVDTIGEMDQGDYFKAVGDLMLQTLRNGNRNTRDRAGEEGGGEAGAEGAAGASEGGGASILDMIVAMADAGQKRFDAAIEKVNSLSEDATQKDFTLATAEVQVAGAAQNAVTQAVASVLDAANKAAKNSA